MSESKNEEKETVSFDEMELQSDIRVHEEDRELKPRVRKQDAKASGGSRTGFLGMLVAVLVLAGVAGYLYFELVRLQEKHSSLEMLVASTASNLDSASENLQEAGDQLKQLESRFMDAEKKNKELLKANDALKKELGQKSSDVKKSEKRLSQAQKKRSDLEQRLSREKVAHQATREALDSAKADSVAKLTALETDLLEMRTRLSEEVGALDTANAALQVRLDVATKERDRIKRQFREESEASLKVIQEQGRLEKRNRVLEQENATLSDELVTVRRLLQEKKTLQAGDLVPFSEEVTPSILRYREALPEGVKFPKRLGVVAVHALITETGTVEKAFLLPDQELEADLAKAIASSFYQWKFTPPVFQGKNVKVWQTVLVRSE